MTKTAFVTGSTGFLGINLVKELVRRNWNVTALYVPSADLRYLSGLDLVLDNGPWDVRLHHAECGRLPYVCVYSEPRGKNDVHDTLGAGIRSPCRDDDLREPAHSVDPANHGQDCGYS